MASPQALGGALSYNPLLSGDTNAKLFALQRQAALAQALQTEGMTPLSTQGREIGGVGYKISPLEGVNKLAQALSGNIGQQTAAQDYANIYSPQSDQSDASRSSGGGSVQSDLALRVQQGDPAAVQQYATFLLGNPDTARAGAELLSTTMRPGLAGTTAYNTKLGESAAGYAPAGAMPSGMGQGIIPGSSQGVGASPQTDALSPQSNAAALAVARGGGQVPPIDLQSGGIQPISASTLMAPQGVGSIPNPPPGAQPTSQAPQPMPGESNNVYQARLKAWEAGQSSQQETTGKATGDAIKGEATIDSRIANAKDIIAQLKNIAPNTSYGIATGLKEDYANQWDPEKAKANASFQNLNSNLFTQELPGIVQASGGRIDIPLVNAIKSASSVDLSLHPQAKAEVLDNLSKLLDQVQQNAHNQVGNLTNKSPSISPAATHIWTPQGIKPVGQQ